MTDLERFLDTYKQFGVELKTEENDNGNISIFLHSKTYIFDGYFGFFSDLEFTKDGKFLRQGFWE